MNENAARREFTFDRVVRIIITLVLTCAGIWLLNRLSDVLLPFLVAWLMAYMLEPFVQRNRAVLHVKGRVLPILLTLFEVVLVCVVLGVVFVPSIMDEMHQMAALFRAYATSNAHIAFVPPEVHEFLHTHIDFQRISEQMTRQDMRSLLNIAGNFLSGGFNLLLGIFNWFLVLLYLVFIMLDYEKLLRGFRHMVPPRYRRQTFRIGNDVKRSMNLYFRGQALVAFCVGILFCIGFLIVGLPLAVVLGLFIGMLNMVPYLQLISLPITTVLCLVYSMQGGVDFWPVWWQCMAVYIVVQCIQDLVLTPKIMGKAMGLNPAIILLSLSVWGSLLGFIGMIIALPLTTLLLAYYNEYIINRPGGGTKAERRRDADALRDMVEED